jgi:acyl-CoA oxidase
MSSNQKDSNKLISNVHLLPKNFTHNYNSPALAMKKARSKSTIDESRIKDLMMNPTFRDFFEKTVKIMKTDSDLKFLNSYEHDKNTLRANANIIFTKKWKNLNYDYETYKKNPLFFVSTLNVMALLDAGAATKVGVHFGLYTKTLLSLGTEKHQDWVKRAFKLEDYGCFMLTEMGHGSNVQGITTVAVYNPETQEFILNSPVKTAMKFWIGNLAQTANMGVAFANMIVDGHNHGVHGFLIKIRDDDGNILPGLTVGDCGHKMGINSVDNGWALFDSFRVPRDGLLDKFSQVSADGKFTSEIKSPSLRFAVQIGALSGGRIGVGSATNIFALIGSAIAIRYGTVRKQFGEKKGMENTLMDYPLVHTKLISRVANSLVYLHSADVLDYEYFNADVSNLKDIKTKELHALSSYIKVAGSWNLQQTLSKSRELCGGHGYSAYSNLAVLINDTDVHVTWEGTNEVLLQQTCKNLMTEFNLFYSKDSIRYRSLKFLKDFKSKSVDIDGAIEKILNFTEEITTGDLGSLIKAMGNSSSRFTNAENQKIVSSLRDILPSLQILLQARIFNIIPKVLSKFQQYFKHLNETKGDAKKTFSRTLPNILFPAATFYGEHFCFDVYLKHILGTLVSPDSRPVYLFAHKPYYGSLDKEMYFPEIIFMMKSLVLFASNTLLHSASFLSGISENIDYDLFNSLSDIILKVSESMRYDVLTIGDLLNSPIADQSSIGAYDGDIYNNITKHIFARSNNFGSNPSWDLIRQFRIENSKK